MEINKELFHYFIQSGTKLTYNPRNIIYMQEDSADTFYLITKGKVRVFMIDSSGEEITLEILQCGRIFGESSFIQNSYRPTTVEALSEVELISCQLNKLYPYLQESYDLTVTLLQLMSHTCNHLSILVKKAYTYNRYEKVASFLLEQKERSLHYTHEDISYMVGLSRVTVSKVLSEFSKKQYIELGYRKIIILDTDGLQSYMHDATT